MTAETSNMAECPDCSGKVSKRAPQCPQCGCPLESIAAMRLDGKDGIVTERQLLVQIRESMRATMRLVMCSLFFTSVMLVVVLLIFWDIASWIDK